MKNAIRTTFKILGIFCGSIAGLAGILSFRLYVINAKPMHYFREATYVTKDHALHQGTLIVKSITENEYFEANGQNVVKNPDRSWNHGYYSLDFQIQINGVFERYDLCNLTDLRETIPGYHNVVYGNENVEMDLPESRGSSMSISVRGGHSFTLYPVRQ